jgi:hypothetical protein
MAQIMNRFLEQIFPALDLLRQAYAVGNLRPIRLFGQGERVS